jgi:hypothetical protein
MTAVNCKVFLRIMHQFSAARLKEINRRIGNRKWYRNRKYELAVYFSRYCSVLRIQLFFRTALRNKIQHDCEATNDTCPITLEEFSDPDNASKKTFVHLGVRFFAEDFCRYIVANVNFRNPVKQVLMKRRDVVRLRRLVDQDEDLLFMYDNRDALGQRHKEQTNLVQYLENDCAASISYVLCFANCHIDLLVHQLNNHRFSFYSTFLDLFDIDALRARACLGYLKDLVTAFPAERVQSETHRDCVNEFVDIFIHFFFS